MVPDGDFEPLGEIVTANSQTNPILLTTGSHRHSRRLGLSTPRQRSQNLDGRNCASRQKI